MKPSAKTKPSVRRALLTLTAKFSRRLASDKNIAELRAGYAAILKP